MAAGLSSQLYGQGGIPLWTNRYNGPGNADDMPVAIATADNGNVFITGNSDASGFGTNYDFATVAYSGAGIPLWTNRYGCTRNTNDYATALAVGNNGNVFVTGYSWNGSNYVFLTLAYSGGGVPLWTNRYKGVSGKLNEMAKAIAVNKDGIVFVTGASIGACATLAYSDSGLPLWTNRFSVPSFYQGQDEPSAIAVDENGKVFVTGYSRSFYNYFSYLTLAYSDTGLALWTNLYALSGVDVSIASAVDGNGNIILTGTSQGLLNSLNYLTEKYSGAGELLWSNLYDGLGKNFDQAKAVAVDLLGNVFVAGYSASATNVPGSLYEFAVVAYSATGGPQWTNRFHGLWAQSAHALDLAVDADGNVFATGSVYGTNMTDFATVAYTREGLALWTNYYDGPGHFSDGAISIAVDRSGNVIVTGLSPATNGSYDYATIKYSSSIRPARLEFENSDGQFVLRWTNATFNLQSAPTTTGTFTNIPGATSPHTNPTTGAQQFFRLISN